MFGRANIVATYKGVEIVDLSALPYSRAVVVLAFEQVHAGNSINVHGTRRVDLAPVTYKGK